MDRRSRIYVAGHQGMVGSAVVRRLLKAGFQNLILRTSKELDLTRQAEVEKFFLNETPEYVFLAAARVGGIMANKTYRAEFIYSNLQIQNNVIHNAYQTGVKKLLFFSSSCVYPRMCPQPMKEEYLWSGALEPTNEPYAVAKLAGMSMCRAYNNQYGTHFIFAIPTNLYGLTITSIH
jgi:GDP-L-fucose synthase